MEKKKLKLNKEAIASLNSMEMSALQGGFQTDQCAIIVDTILIYPHGGDDDLTAYNTACGEQCTSYGAYMAQCYDKTLTDSIRADCPTK